MANRLWDALYAANAAYSASHNRFANLSGAFRATRQHRNTERIRKHTGNSGSSRVDLNDYESERQKFLAEGGCPGKIASEIILGLFQGWTILK